MRFDRERFLDIAANYLPRIVRLSPEGLTLFLSTADLTANRWDWENNDGTPLTDSEWDAIEADVDRAYKELMVNPMLGTIAPFITATPPDGMLECDGSIYLRTDYPDLYAALDTTFVMDADHFIVPDLRGRVMLGAGSGSGLSAYAVADNGGEETHVLVTAEIPAHSHAVTDLGHSHAEGTAAPNLTTIGPGAPEPTAIPAPGVTAVATTGISIQNSGGDGSHENRQPYTALRMGIWAI